MAVLFITEFTNLFQAGGQAGQMAQGSPVASQTVAIGAGSVQSAAFNAATNFIRVHTDVICSIAIGANPTASAVLTRLAANQTEYFGVAAGQKLAVITNV